MFQDITLGEEQYDTSIERNRFIDAFPPKRKKEKTYLLIPFVLKDAMMGGSDDICCGIVGEQWSRFCSSIVRDHRKKMWKYTNMVDRYYINESVTSRAFLEPCLPKAAALRFPTFSDLLNNGEGKSLKTWTFIFWHLTNKAREANAHTPVRGGWARDRADMGLMEFAMAMKTPG